MSSFRKSRFSVSLSTPADVPTISTSSALAIGGVPGVSESKSPSFSLRSAGAMIELLPKVLILRKDCRQWTMGQGSRVSAKGDHRRIFYRSWTLHLYTP